MNPNRWIAVLVPLSFLAVTVTAQPPSPGGDPAHRITITTQNPQVLQAALAAQGYDVDCCGAVQSGVEAIVSQQELSLLTGHGYTINVEETAEPLAAKLAREDIPVGYHDLAAIVGILNTTQANFPAIAQVVNIAATYGPGATFEGRPIYAIKISDNVTTDEDEPNVMMLACHHCREITTPELILDILSRLTLGYGTNPQITSLIDNHEIWLIPVVNPDGLNYVWTTNNLWRKNRKPNGNGTFGVDLNRNYNLGWSGACAGSTTTSSETYKGPSPDSELEVQTIQGFARARRFAKVMDFHSYGREVLLTYLCSVLPPTIQTFIDAQGVALSTNAAGYLTRQPSAEGEHFQWEIKEITSYSYLTEVDTTFQPAYSQAIAEAATTWPLSLAFLSRAIPLQGHVKDAVTGAPIIANITVGGITWSNGETRKSHGLHGYWHLFMPAGSFAVTFAAPGYVTKTVNLTATASGTTNAEVRLVPTNGAFALDLTTIGNGTGNLHCQLYSVPATTTEGFTVFSLDTVNPVGSGPALGIYLDAVAIQCLLAAPGVGNPLHFISPFTPGAYPQVPFDIPAPALASLTGQSADGIAVGLSALGTLTGATNIVRITF